MKVCTKCETLKENFSKHPHTKDGLQSWCKDCVQRRGIERRKELRRNPETRDAVLAADKKRYWENPANPRARQKRSRTKCKYGITLEQRNEMFVAQGERCASCGSPEPRSKKGWALDHSHETGENRGILCHSCNVVLGLVHESIEHLSQLAAYLRRYQKSEGVGA